MEISALLKTRTTSQSIGPSGRISTPTAPKRRAVSHASDKNGKGAVALDTTLGVTGCCLDLEDRRVMERRPETSSWDGQGPGAASRGDLRLGRRSRPEPTTTGLLAGRPGSVDSARQPFFVGSAGFVAGAVQLQVQERAWSCRPAWVRPWWRPALGPWLCGYPGCTARRYAPARRTIP